MPTSLGHMIFFATFAESYESFAVKDFCVHNGKAKIFNRKGREGRKEIRKGVVRFCSIASSTNIPALRSKR
jgi:hypothetical protein